MFARQRFVLGIDGALLLSRTRRDIGAKVFNHQSRLSAEIGGLGTSSQARERERVSAASVSGRIDPVLACAECLHRWTQCAVRLRSIDAIGRTRIIDAWGQRLRAIVAQAPEKGLAATYTAFRPNQGQLPVTHASGHLLLQD